MEVPFFPLFGGALRERLFVCRTECELFRMAAKSSYISSTRFSRGSAVYLSTEDVSVQATSSRANRWLAVCVGGRYSNIAMGELGVAFMQNQNLYQQSGG